MEYIALGLIVSFIYMVHIMKKKHISIISNYGVFLIFSIMYSVFPLLTYFEIEPELWFRHYSLNEDGLVVGTQIVIMSICNVIFSYVYETRLKKEKMGKFFQYKKGENLVFIIFLFMSMIAIYLGGKSDYVSVRTEGEHSLISNFKTLLAGVYIAYLVFWGRTKKTIIMFLLFVMLMLIEKSRWYFFSIFIGTIVYIVNEQIVKTRNVFIGAALLVLLMSVVGLYRANVEIEDYSLLLNPFYIEGDYGSYMILQTYQLLYTDSLMYCTFFVDYFIDPIIYFIPRMFFLAFGLEKDSSTLFSVFINDHQIFLSEGYAPVGGFHYLAQASSALPFIGPMLVTYFFSRICVFFENKKNINIKGKFAYYIFTSGFAFVFIKTQFQQTIKYGMTLFLPAMFIYLLIIHINQKELKGK